MKKKIAGFIILIFVLIGFGTKYNLLSMDSNNQNALHEQIAHIEQDKNNLKKQIDRIDKKIQKKYKELKTAGRFEEFVVAREADQLVKYQQELTKKMIDLDNKKDQLNKALKEIQKKELEEKYRRDKEREEKQKQEDAEKRKLDQELEEKHRRDKEREEKQKQEDAEKRKLNQELEEAINQFKEQKKEETILGSFIKTEDTEKKFWRAIPKKYHTELLQKASVLLGGEEYLQKFYEVTQENNSDVPDLFFSIALIAKILLQDNTSTISRNGLAYIFSDLLKGQRNDYTKNYISPVTDDLITYATTQDKNLIPDITSLYKIHLMPKKDDLIDVLIKLFSEIAEKKDLQKLINSIKIAYNDIPYRQTKHNDHTRQNAVIVIYPQEGKENVQKLLNELYRIFKDYPGMNVRPRFNAKVTDLIWIAQGNGDMKNNSRYAHYFEQPDRIYYNPKVFGIDADFHLVHPETGQPLTAY